MAARFARPCMLSVVLTLAVMAQAAAQNRRQEIRSDFQGVIERSPMTGLASQSRYSPNDQTPSTYEQARQPYIAAAPYSYLSPSCNPQREAMLRRATMMQARRDQEAQRREQARNMLRTLPPSDEQQAAAKFQGAHLLWQNGNLPAARRWLDEILNKFPNTTTADRATEVLTRL